MTKHINQMKKSAALLVFFLSAAAWAAHKLPENQQVPPEDSSIQADNANDGIILRPLTD